MLTTLILLALPAMADTVELGSGATLEARILAWEPSGDCRLGVEEGPLAGAVVLVPCGEILRFCRTQPEPAILLPNMGSGVMEVPLEVSSMDVPAAVEAPAAMEAPAVVESVTEVEAPPAPAQNPELVRAPDGTEWRRVSDSPPAPPAVEAPAPAFRGPLPVNSRNP